MATTASPYGLRPVNALGGRPYAGSTRMFPIASAATPSIFFGDVVKAVNDGTVTKDTGTSTATPIGVFMGCQYTSGTLGYFQTSQYWPTGTVASDALAFVVDDPWAVFQAQADGSIAQTGLFNNSALVQGSGSTLTGDSGVGINHTTDTTSTLPTRIVGFVNGPTSAVGDAYTDCLIIWNFGTHRYLVATGT